MMGRNNIIRGGNGFTVNEGLTTEGKTRCSIEDANPDPTYLQPVRRAPIKLEIYFNEGDLNGEVYDIRTNWKTVMYSNSAKPLEGNIRFETMITGEADRAAFVAMFAPALKFIINGYVRADLGGNKTGWNDMPVFDQQGAIITYTPEQEAEPPTDAYYNPPAPETPVE